MILYTIGHSNVPLETFIELLRKHEVCTVVDVRSAPHTKYATWFDREYLEKPLRLAGLSYHYAGDLLGGRPKDPTCYRDGRLPEGKADYMQLVNYETVRTRDWFQKGVARLLELAGQNPTAIMCSEEDPWKCHRHNLISQELLALGITVQHIRGSGLLEPADQPPPKQLQLFKGRPMQIYTIGFTKKSAETFFSILKQNQVTCVVDIRVHPGGQLAGFTKQEDLRYFLRELIGCGYRHLPKLTPSEAMLKAYHANPDWEAYEGTFNRLMDERGVPEILDRTLFEEYACCLLCSEATPEHCHRRLVAERLCAAWGAQVIHL